MPSPTARYSFDRLVLDLSTQRLLRDGKPLKLPARALELLAALLERRHRVISKGELLEVMGTRRAMEPAELQRLVSVLRRILGAEMIQTVPGRGWRCVASPTGASVRDFRWTSAQVEGIEGASRTLADSVHAGARPPVRPLLGREADLAVLAALLAEHRFITVVGREGVGKTQLAAHALAHRGATVWADLSRLKAVASVGMEPMEPIVSTVAATIAEAFGSRHPAPDPLGDLARALRLLEPPGLWLVLDETTQSGLPRDAVAHVVRTLLDATPLLHVLLLSAQALDLPGEALLRLHPLPVPAAHADAASARQSTALRLVLAQARRADRSFSLDLRDTPACDAACQLVRHAEGIPMALELLGARLPALGAPRLLAELQRHRAALAADAHALRASPVRQVMDWTLQRLTSGEVDLLKQLCALAAEHGDIALSVLEPACFDTLDALIDLAVVHLVPASDDAGDHVRVLGAWRHHFKHAARRAD